MPPRCDDSDFAMIIRKWRKPSHIVTLSCTVASVEGCPPLVGFSEEIDKAWRDLLVRHKLKQRSQNSLCKNI
ncbi:hypothetical protein ANCCAN_17140 [Ancylostoma caninum]|uniref:Uncharacterized protein n=1 Tax=Ancylostoma caninum TaxID=29170 RepID=A0A368FXS2_ANCCA|nr:hypothetical protein ANCCAN_17140 [Ancylostoma caninum]